MRQFSCVIGLLQKMANIGGCVENYRIIPPNLKGVPSMDLNLFEFFYYFFLPMKMILTSPAFWVLIAFWFVFYRLLPELLEMPNKIAKRQAEAQAQAEEERFNARARKTGVASVDEMNGRQFEKWLKVKFEQMGYKVRLKGDSKDQGADLVLFKSGVKTVVQAKKRTSQNIGVSVLGEVLRAMKYHNASRGIVVTNQYFTRELMKETTDYDDIELWDRKRLIKEIERSQ